MQDGLTTAMHRRHARRRFLAALGALGTPIGGSFASGARAAESYTMRFSASEAANSLQGMTATRFASAVGRRSKGQLTIEVYPNHQILNQQSTVDGLTNGVADFVTITSSVFVPVVPRLQVFDVPFLFKDTAAGFRVLDGPVGTELSAELESKGILALSWASSGMREFSTTTKAILVPEDMKGLRVRIQSGSIYVATYQALGAIPIVIDMVEAYVALAQHTVDAIEVPIDGLTTQKMYTVCKHVALLNQQFSPQAIYGSKRKIEALPIPLQKIVKDEAKAVVPLWRSLLARQIADDIEVLKKNGVAFTEPDQTPFRKMVQPVYAMMQAKLGDDLIERVSRATAAR
jgi:TRAP-type transport system periplasmic protein